MKDYFGVDVAELKQKKLFLFDMDGTIYNENTLFDGTLSLLKQIQKMGGRYVFITNNSSKSVFDYIQKVNKLGIEASEEHFFTSAQATVIMLKEKHPNAKVYCQGTESLLQELENAGVRVTKEAKNDVDVVLVGFDTELTSEKLRNTCQILQQSEVAFYATNPDLRCPVDFGYIPDCGSICQMLYNATEKRPIYIGKPEPTMVELVRRKYGFSKAETVVIGDRLYTDIAAGVNAGVTSICVLTGEATVQEIQASEIKPTYTFASVKELLECYTTGM